MEQKLVGSTTLHTIWLFIIYGKNCRSSIALNTCSHNYEILSSTFTYHGKKVVINQPQEKLTHDEHSTHDMHNSLSIDDADIHIMTLQDGTFATHYFPYWSYDSLEKVAKDLIDKVPEFGPHLIRRRDS